MFFHPRPPWGIAASNRDGVSGCYVLGSCATRKSCSCRGSTSTCIWILGLGVGKWIGKSWKSVGPKVNGGASDRVWEKINQWKPAIYIWRKHSLDVMLKSPHNFTSAPLYEDPWIHVELLRKRKSHTSHLLTYMLRWGTADATGCCFWISCRKNGCNEVYIYTGSKPLSESLDTCVEPIMTRPKHLLYGSSISCRRFSSSASACRASDSNISTPSWSVLQLQWRLLLTVPSDLIRRAIPLTPDVHLQTWPRMLQHIL